MVKKYISSFLTIFMALTIASPLLSMINTSKPCCQHVEMNCCTQQAADDCPMEMNSGNHAVVLLLISGPKAISSQTDNLIGINQSHIEFVSLGAPDAFVTDIRATSSSPPISFLTPLLI